jgi:formylglycine-generating enzyme required for sulfatase activity
MADAGAGEKLKVFISYSRRDSAAFADELLAGLEVTGFAPFLDRHDITAGEDWEKRLGSLIEQSDTVVFVISPEAVKSERCVWEVDRTIELSKRLFPVIFKQVPTHEIPEKLSRLQFVNFDSDRGVMRPLGELADALRQDLDWIRDHTRLGEIATRWDKRGRPESLLLRGDDIDAAKRWLAARNATAPEITDAQRAFVRASEEAEVARIGKERAQLEATARQKKRVARLLAGVTALVAAVITALIGWFNQAYLQEQFNWFWTERPYRVANFDDYVLKPERERALKAGDSFRECLKDCPEMVVVPAGEFMMGSSATEKGHHDNEGPQHKVTIAKPFAVSKFAVTFADWNACVSVGGCPQVSAISKRDITAQQRSAWAQLQSSWAVSDVNWDDAQQYVAWLSKMTGRAYRLLSEAEWEYAGRAGSTTAYFWGDEVGEVCRECGREGDGLSPVESLKPNAFGLYDMAGRVWEWVQDCYEKDYNGAPTDGSAWITSICPMRVTRGGVWSIRPEGLRAALRNGAFPSARMHIVGFRLGRTLTP